MPIAGTWSVRPLIERLVNIILLVATVPDVALRA